jgi:hypothetical protein
MVSEIGACLDAFGRTRSAVADDYRAWDANFIDHSVFGDKTYQYHPRGLPSADSVPTLAVPSTIQNQSSPVLRTTLPRSTTMPAGSPSTGDVQLPDRRRLLPQYKGKQPLGAESVSTCSQQRCMYRCPTNFHR